MVIVDEVRHLAEYKGSSQEKANKRYSEKVMANEELRNRRNQLSRYRSVKSYIRLHATKENIKELEDIIKERKQILKNPDHKDEK